MSLLILLLQQNRNYAMNSSLHLKIMRQLSIIDVIMFDLENMANSFTKTVTHFEFQR